MLRVSKLVAALAAAALVACSTLAPIQNVNNVAVSNSATKALDAEQVRGAIVRAGATLGWIMLLDFLGRGTPGRRFAIGLSRLS